MNDELRGLNLQIPVKIEVAGKGYAFANLAEVRAALQQELAKPAPDEQYVYLLRSLLPKAS